MSLAYEREVAEASPAEYCLAFFGWHLRVDELHWTNIGRRCHGIVLSAIAIRRHLEGIQGHRELAWIARPHSLGEQRAWLMPHRIL